MPSQTGPEAKIAEWLADCYGLKNSNESIKKIFRHSFSYAFVSSNQARKVFSNEIADAMNDLRYIVENKEPRAGGRLGHKEIKALPTKGKYVIFSDHHLLYSGHRQNFFGQNNLETYVTALNEYNKAEYTLIENGDMEDLIILDPAHEDADMLDEFDARKDLLKKSIDNDRVVDNDSLNRLIGRRIPFRLRQYKKILADPQNTPLYMAISSFLGKNRYIKIAGNHDYDIQKPEFLAAFNENLRRIYQLAGINPARTPILDKVYDYVLLTPNSFKSRRHVDFVILHGHQFDKASNPRSAPVAGEVYSEGAAWGYQGADRNWKRTDTDNDRLYGWSHGDGFRNNLVSDNAESASLLGTKGETFESLFHHTIAWEYFVSKPGLAAFENEVATGKQFFKYRHLDENIFVDLFSKAFPVEGMRPAVLFGHSHEVRMNPWHLKKVGEGVLTTGEMEYNGTATRAESFPQYCNSGSAGRFEKLIWGIEIEDGKAQVISWYNNNGKVERHVYKDFPANYPDDGSVLRADPEPEALD